ncbi:MAG: glycine betaine ABC transporter substrate-binding protein [Thermoleophilaceae bacterium]
MTMRRLPVVLGLLLVALALVAAACGDDEEDKEGSAQPQGDELVLTLGTKNFTEAFIVGELYRQALRSNSINVKLRKDIGPTEVMDKELQSGAIDAYPEYLGVAVTVAAGRDDAGGTAEETYALAKDFYAGRGQAISEQTAFENVDAIATTQFFAQRRGLATVGDLRALPRFTLGARPEFEERRQGLAGMRDVYGLDNVEFEAIPIGEQYRALDRNEIDAANVFTTDGQLASGSYKVLEDTERVFGFQHVALVIDEDKLQRLGGRDFMRIINDVNAQLTTSAMIQMNRDVELDGQDPEIVAERFLRTAGLLGGGS